MKKFSEFLNEEIRTSSLKSGGEAAEILKSINANSAFSSSQVSKYAIIGDKGVDKFRVDLGKVVGKNGTPIGIMLALNKFNNPEYMLLKVKDYNDDYAATEMIVERVYVGWGGLFGGRSAAFSKRKWNTIGEETLSSIAKTHQQLADMPLKKIVDKLPNTEYNALILY